MMGENGEHNCIQEKEIGRMCGIMTNIVKEFYGNGNEGLTKTIPRLEVKISTLTEATTIQATAISALAKAVARITIIKEYRSKTSDMTWKRTSIIVSAIIGVSAILTSIILELL